MVPVLVVLAAEVALVHSVHCASAVLLLLAVVHAEPGRARAVAVDVAAGVAQPLRVLGQLVAQAVPPGAAHRLLRAPLQCECY